MKFDDVRKIAGMLSVIVLLSLIVADFVSPELQLAQRHVETLLLLIGAMLAADVLMGKVPITITMDRNNQNNGNDDGNNG